MGPRMFTVYLQGTSIRTPMDLKGPVLGPLGTPMDPGSPRVPRGIKRRLITGDLPKNAPLAGRTGHRCWRWEGDLDLVRDVRLNYMRRIIPHSPFFIQSASLQHQIAGSLVSTMDFLSDLQFRGGLRG